MKIFRKEKLIDLAKCILWQYDKSTKLNNLISQKQNWYKKNVSDFINLFFVNIFNLQTANDFGLSVWGKILNFPRQVANKNNGTIINLSTEQYRFLLLGQILKFDMECSVPEINKYLRLIFNQKDNKKVYVIDNYDMSMQYIIEIPISDEIQFLVDNVNFLPRPSGVRIIFTQTKLYRVEIVNYQGATITFTVNGETITNSYVDVEPETDVSWVISKSGYYTQTGSESNVQSNITRNITLVAVESYTVNIGYFAGNGALHIWESYGTKTITEDGTYRIEIAGGKSRFVPEASGSTFFGGKITMEIPLVIDDVVRIDAIPSGYITSNSYDKDCLGGSGVALYINDVLVAVAGGGAGSSILIPPLGYMSVGGGGYKGGNGPQVTRGNVVIEGRGLGAIDGTRNNVNTEDTPIGACGGGTGGLTGETYGGSGYINSDYSEYVIEIVSGTYSSGNNGSAYAKVNYKV